MSSRTDDDSLAWEIELDRLELDIVHVERLIQAMKPLERSDWVAPALSTPLPQHLVARATDIHERQRKALTKILRSLTQAQRHQRYVDRTSAEEPSVPLYLDITA
jgi:hypothetical protein